PGAGERDLADRRRRLAVLEPERGLKLEHAAAERDRARGNHQDVAVLAVQPGDVGRERGEPGLVEAARPGVDHQRGTDFHDDAAKIAEHWGFARHAEIPVPATSAGAAHCLARSEKGWFPLKKGCFWLHRGEPSP